ncbi:MAG: hypothetical protein K2L25_03350 [Alphaproteobacteria bacterium]|nr:hypothetical protein [Alphaproteobacteria bacterium]
MKKIMITALLIGALATGYSFAAVGDLEMTICAPTGTSCSLCTSYKCNSGYYGTATSALSGCTKCPSNATCAGGNNSTFKCNKGYYKNGTSCSLCPFFSIPNNMIQTGTTSGTGATAITECYIPSGSEFSDTSGSGSYTGDCYYTN